MIFHHDNCHIMQPCRRADCPYMTSAAIAARNARIANAGEPWCRLEHGQDGGGYRDFLAGRPVHCGTSLELQVVDTGEDDYGTYNIFTTRGVLVRYELDHREVFARTDWTTERTIVWYADVAGHSFTRDHDDGMRFRWPPRRD